MKKKRGIQISRLISNSIFLILLSVSSVYALCSAAQVPDKKLDIKSGSVASVFDQIRKQTDMEFFYETGIIDMGRMIDNDLAGMTLPQILDRVLGSGYDYVFQDNYILITKRTVQQPAVVNIHGRVVNERGEPLSGATVRISGTDMQIGTAADGTFTFRNIPSAGRIELRFSFLGMQTVTVAYDGKDMNIVMKESAAAMDTVVVTGFFKRRKEGFAGTVTTLTREELQKVSTGNIFNTISMLDAGFKVIENNDMGSNPNVLPEFNIRGKGSFQEGSMLPLFILDGIETTVQTVFDLDINRIESITLLKDASAAILYGSRAANGVVVIETLLPQSGDIRITYSFKPTISFADLTGYDLMNAAEKLEYEALAGLYGEGYDINETYKNDAEYYKRYKNVMEGVDTYWLSQPVRNSFSHQHSLRAEGGAEEITYAIDAGYNDTQGVMKGSGRTHTSFGMTLGYRIRDVITFQNRVTYGYTHAFESPYGSYSRYALANPYERIYDADGNFLPILLNGEPNPLYDTRLPNRNFTNSETMSEQLFVDWKANDNLRFRGQFAITKTNTNGEKYTSPLSAYYILTTKYNADIQQHEPIAPEDRGELAMSHSRGVDASGSLTMTYDRTFGSHLMFIGAGGEFRSNTARGDGYILTGFSDDRFSDPAYAIRYKKNEKATSSESTVHTLGVFASLNYIYDNRYFADMSVRVDGSSAYGSDKRYALLWSVGAGWNLHNESFWNKNSRIDVLRLRVSYGLTGNQNFSAYQARTTFMTMTDRTYWYSMPAVLMGYGNSDLAWQRVYSANAGFDFSFDARRIMVSFNYYDKTTKRTITDITVAPSIGLPDDNYIANLGEIRNSGYEFEVSGAIIRSRPRDLEWRLTVQGAYNRNRIIKISNMLKGVNDKNNEEKVIPRTVYEEGESMEAIKAVKSLGIDPVTGQEIYVKKDGTLTYVWDAADKITAGVREPKLFGNISSNLQYRNWNFNVRFSYTFGADYYNQTLASRVEGANPAYNADRRVLNDRWKKPGDYALYKNIAEYKSNFISTRFVQRDNTIRLTSLSASYDITGAFLKRYGLRMVRVSGYANDLLRLSSIKEERGLNYPFARSFVFELKLMF